MPGRGTARAGGASAGAAFLSELAARVATGAAAISVVLDPGLVVLGGEVGLADGPALASRVEAEVARISPASPHVGANRGPPRTRPVRRDPGRGRPGRSELLHSVAG